jgi:hypothetical protein
MSNKKGNNYIIDKENNIAKIELTRRDEESLWTIIDLDDLERVLNFPYTWSASYRKNSDSWYATASIYKPKTTMSLNYFIAKVDQNSDLCVDHFNHDTLDNRKENLRITDVTNNSRHRKGRNRNNITGYRNVMYNKTYPLHPYVVQLQINGKNTVLGKFADVDEAGAFAKRMRHKYYGEFEGNS